AVRPKSMAVLLASRLRCAAGLQRSGNSYGINRAVIEHNGQLRLHTLAPANRRQSIVFQWFLSITGNVPTSLAALLLSCSGSMKPIVAFLAAVVVSGAVHASAERVGAKPTIDVLAAKDLQSELATADDLYNSRR